MAGQIDEAELLAQGRVVQTVNQMLAHPEARKLVLKARKLADPNAVIPEIDAAAPMLSELAEIKKQLAEEAAARVKEREERETEKRVSDMTSQIERQKANLRAAGWRDEGLAEIEKFALENGVSNLEIAASHWEKLHPPAEPVQPKGYGSWNFFEDQQTEDDGKFVKAMIETRGEDEGALNAEIRAALSEVRSQPVARR